LDSDDIRLANLFLIEVSLDSGKVQLNISKLSSDVCEPPDWVTKLLEEENDLHSLHELEFVTEVVVGAQSDWVHKYWKEVPDESHHQMGEHDLGGGGEVVFILLFNLGLHKLVELIKLEGLNVVERLSDQVESIGLEIILLMLDWLQLLLGVMTHGMAS